MHDMIAKLSDGAWPLLARALSLLNELECIQVISDIA